MGAVDPTQYVVRLGAALVGPRRARRDLLREVADHLEDASEAYVRAGLTEAEAGARAVADFGTVAEVAPGLQTTLAVASSRRTVALLLTVLGVQPFLWDSGLAGLLGLDGAASEPSGRVYAVLDGLVEYGGGVVMAGALLLLVGCGIGNRWFHAGPRIALVTGWFGLAAAVVLPLIGLAMTALAARAEAGAWLLLVALLVAPLVLVGVSARRTLATV